MRRGEKQNKETLIALVLWKMQLRLEAYLTLAITLSSALLKNGLQRAINRPRPSPLLVEVHQKSKGKKLSQWACHDRSHLLGMVYGSGSDSSQEEKSLAKVLFELAYTTDRTDGANTYLSGGSLGK
jgi:hypothetical protein